MNFKWLTFVLVYSYSFILISQDVHLDITKNPSQYVLRSWSTEEGMASESTNEILQSDDGYIWIATYAGLHRFDGKDFTVFNTSNSNIPTPTILRLATGINGEIWIGTQHGPTVFNSGNFKDPTGGNDAFSANSLAH